jgi:hypothetical protein|mmetsp:Transcript_28229/g.37658  ORF Transcript_28229/g.37658 Transcript_28229/m.37658 type:complete len:86 (-) Transcript_28229:506-763(-)
MSTIGILFGSALVGQATLYLSSAVLLIFDTQLQLFDFLLQTRVLIVEVVDELLDVDALVTCLVHALEEPRDDFIKTLSQVSLLFR